jgi:hypothetical protein
MQKNMRGQSRSRAKCLLFQDLKHKPAVNEADPTLAAITTPASVPPEQAISNRSLIQAVKAVNEAGNLGNNKEVTFQIDRTTKLPVIQIVDRSTAGI